MRNSNLRVSEAEAAKLLTIAARLHAHRQQSFSIEDLIRAGEEVDLPPAVIYEAIVQTRLQQRLGTAARFSPPTQPRRRYLLPLLGAIAGLMLSLPLYPATKSGEYASPAALYVGELAATMIRILPPSVGLTAGVWLNRRRSR